MKLEITRALRAYFRDQAFRNAIDGLMPRIDGSKAIQSEKIDEYLEFNDALLTAAQVRHDLIAFLMSACKVSYLNAVKEYDWSIDWNEQPPSKILEDTDFFITVKHNKNSSNEIGFFVEIDISKDILSLNSNLFNTSNRKYISVNVTEMEAKASGLKVKSDGDEDDPTDILSSNNFDLSENLARPDDFAKELAKVGTTIVSLMMK